MDRILLALALIAIALGLFALRLPELIPERFKDLLLYGGWALIVVAVVIVIPVLTAVKWLDIIRERFGPCPLPRIHDLDEKKRIAEKKTELPDLDDQLISAAIKGKIKFYGQLQIESGIESRITEVPVSHFETHSIVVGWPFGPDDAFTFDRTKDKVIGIPGCYYNLHVNKGAAKTLKIIGR
jgi:hypothetical protein